MATTSSLTRWSPKNINICGNTELYKLGTSRRELIGESVVTVGVR